MTWNRGDFPAEPLQRLGLRVADPDEYLHRNQWHAIGMGQGP